VNGEGALALSSLSASSAPSSSSALPIPISVSVSSTAFGRTRKPISEDEAKAFRTPEHGAFSIAFPSISSDEFAFDDERAASVAIRVIDHYLARHPDPRIRLIMVEPDPSSRVLQLLEGYHRDPRFIAHVGDITEMRSEGYPCRFIVNRCNWRFKPKGDRLNSAINEAAGPALSEKSVKLYNTAKVGNAYNVPLTAEDPQCVLWEEQCVDSVIQVRGPNMNPSRPDCLEDDYEKGVPLLRQAYESLLQCFEDLTGLVPPPSARNPALAQAYQQVRFVLGLGLGNDSVTCHDLGQASLPIGWLGGTILGFGS